MMKRILAQPPPFSPISTVNYRSNSAKKSATSSSKKDKLTNAPNDCNNVGEDATAPSDNDDITTNALRYQWLSAMASASSTKKIPQKEPETLFESSPSGDEELEDIDRLITSSPTRIDPKDIADVVDGKLSPSERLVEAKKIEFQPYKSTRPDLLQQLELMVSLRLQNIDSSTVPISPNPTTSNKKVQRQIEKLLKLNPSSKVPIRSISPPISGKQDSKESNGSTPELIPKKFPLSYYHEKKQTYSSAFQKYIDESTLYKKILQEIKDAYDEYIRQIEDVLDPPDAEEVAKKEQAMVDKLKETQLAHKIKVQSLEETIRALEEKYSDLDKEKKKVDSDFAKFRESTNVMKRDFEDMKSSCTTLTASLSRMEEDYRLFQAHEASRIADLSHYKSVEQKLGEEIDRLQVTIQNLEHSQAGMVSHEVVAGLETVIFNLKEENRRLETSHRQLLIRYAALKGVVDDCFKQWEASAKQKLDQTIKEEVNKVLQDSIKLTSRSTNKGFEKQQKDPVLKV